ncbi:hypothetical protein TWF970_001345 [Orbilia oligospora]|uniref:Thioredoxin domain-containing protein n=1 Tax=Orbilia oligospora TaxID=2813651 RepID=A0A7C8RE16_ORBOL|nr:hypothetical protein TWF970_001345 [Orbilia oligospora]
MPMKTEEVTAYEDFQAKLAHGKPIAVFLFWTECGYCDDIAPFFEEQFLHDNHKHIEFFRVDKESDLGRKFRADYSIKAYRKLEAKGNCDICLFYLLDTLPNPWA